MKNILTIWGFVAMAVLSACSQGNNLVAKIDGWESCDSVSVMLYYPDGNRVAENLPMHAGRFVFDIPGEMPVRLVASVPKEEDKGYILFSAAIETVVAPTDRVKIKGRVSADGTLHYEAAGAPLAGEIDRLRKEFLPSLAKEDSLQRLIIIDQYEGLPAGEGDRIYTEQGGLYSARKKAEIEYERNFISTHPDHPASAYYATLLPADLYEEYFDMLSQNLREGQWRPWLDERHEVIREEEIRLKVARMNLTSTPAPDFTLRDTSDEQVTLSGLPHDKFMVLDFWGTWCVPCVQGMPRMKEYYIEHAEQLEIVSIACMDDEKRWKKAVEDMELPWINLLNDENSVENNVPILYGVTAYPTKFILSPDNRILFKFVGETDEFYLKLDELTETPGVI